MDSPLNPLLTKLTAVTHLSQLYHELCHPPVYNASIEKDLDISGRHGSAEIVWFLIAFSVG
jgi:hypothetical protein